MTKTGTNKLTAKALLDVHRYFKLGVLVCLVLCGSSACTYRGALRHDFYQPLQSYDKKLPLQVALVQDNKTKAQHFIYITPQKRTIDVALYPALINAMKSELSNLFEEVTLTDDPQRASQEDLLAFMTFNTQEAYRDVLGGHYIFNSEMQLNFKDSQSKLHIASYHHSTKVEYTPPADAYVAAFLTGFSLYLLSPITVPYITNSIGWRATELLESGARTLIQAISDDIRADQRLLAYAKQPSEQPAASLQEIASKPKDTIPQSKYEDFLNSVVVIRSSAGIGSGFFVSSAGLLLTNNHVVSIDKTISISLRSGEVLFGTVVSTDEMRDLALISVNRANTHWLRLGPIEEASVGTEVTAIGAPEGFLTWSLTKGIVSAIREVNGMRLIQTDTAINSGNSGGPLISMQSGNVIGINTFGFRKDLAEGLNFAISSEEALKVFAAFIKAK